MVFGETRKGEFVKVTRWISVSLAAAISLVGCTKQKVESAAGEKSADIFSDRPISSVADLTLVTLNAPPLLVAGKKTARGWEIPNEAKRRVLNEQADFEAKLKQFAPDAKIVYRYRMTLNALAIYTSADLQKWLSGNPLVGTVSPARPLARPQSLNVVAATPQKSPSVTSVNFIGTDAAHKLGYTGKGMRIGILDTGIDYTHAMLGGHGLAADYAAIDPAAPNAAFPNDKVAGGTDLVGSAFDASSPLPEKHLPHPDANPLDEAGHGSHVAGTIAGRGDGVNTYDGVAPDATLYAVKVFGKEGSTADAVVIAGFEFAADPNGDLDPSDQLDVINLSLGGGFGQPMSLYTQAVRNLSRAGTVVVAAAGNSGDVDYVVGAPSTADDAIAVAASVDGADVNWKFDAVRFTNSQNPDVLVKAVEGSLSVPVALAGDVHGDLVDIGDASADLDPAVAAQVSGKVAFILRGKVNFGEKLKRAAAAGAVGAVVYNNQPGEPIPMGGEGKVTIPAIMISQDLGLKLRAEMKSSPVAIHFQTDQRIEEPQNIDTITSFSSRGPRSEDNLIKPEVAAPGQNITSVAMGSGTGAVKMDGTSMASPHMTGVIALLKQAHPDLSSLEIKSLVMNTAKVLGSAQSGEVPMTLQGAGRVQLAQAIVSPVVSETPALSLGRVELTNTQTLTRQITLRNLTPQPVSLRTATEATNGLTIQVPAQITIAAGATETFTATFLFTSQNADKFFFELDGRIYFKQDDRVVLQIPALAIRTEASQITLLSPGGGNTNLRNSSPNKGYAMAFNLIGQMSPKPLPGPTEAWKSRTCDLQSAGYRIVRKTLPQNKGTMDILQVAFKIFKPVTTWTSCTFSMLIDSDGDGVADQELAAVTTGLDGVDALGTSVLLDAEVAREIRLDYEKKLAGGIVSPIDYDLALIAQMPMVAFAQSTITVVETPVPALDAGADGMLHVQIAAQGNHDEEYEADKFLATLRGSWYTISPKLEDQAFYDMEEIVEVPTTGAPLSFTRGTGKQDLVIYYPLNQATVNGVDGQQQVINN